MEFIALVLSLSIAVAIAAWAFRPLVERERASAKQRFQIADIFSIVVLWQFAFALDYLLQYGGRGDSRGPIALLLAIALSALGLGVANTLSRRGITSAARRMACICVGIPLSVGGILTMVPTGAWALYAVCRYDIERPDRAPACILYAGSLAAVIVGRQVIDWSLRGVTVHHPAIDLTDADAAETPAED